MVRGAAALASRFVSEVVLKLQLIFLVIDLLVLLAYPVLYLVHKFRKLFRIQH